MAAVKTPATKTPTPATKTTMLEQHPLAIQLTPGTMSDTEFEALTDDMKRNGQRLAITMHEGKVLDGMHRYRGCLKLGLTPKTVDYAGDDPAGLVIALNVLRRKMGSTQRAVAGARLNLDYNITQDEAAKRVGVSKVHVNLAVQALKSKNARLLKLMENPDLTREQLHDEMVDCGVIKANGVASPTRQEPVTSLTGLAGFFNSIGATDGNTSEDDDLLMGEDDLLGDAPSANGKVLTSKSASSTDSGVTGTRPSHPEHRAKETAASLLAAKLKALPEADRVSFVQIAWHIIRPLIKVAGVSIDPPAGSAAAEALKAVGKAAASAAAAVPPTPPAKPAAKTTRGSKGTPTTTGGKARK